jgi:hypothetical protein
MGLACSRNCWRREIYIGYWWGSQKERKKPPGGWITLKCILEI